MVTRAGDSFDRYITRPPLIAIEILSPEDTVRAIQEKGLEYRAFGVEHVWIIDPEPRITYLSTEAGLQEVKTGELVVEGTPIRVVLSDMFAELDR